MEKLGFTRDDLALFGIEEDDARNERVREELGPRLDAIANRVAAPLSKLAGHRLSATVEVRDAPRPGCEVSIVFASESGRPVLTLGLSRGGMHARLVIERDTPNREEAAKKLRRAATSLAKQLDGIELRRYDDWDHRVLPTPTAHDGASFWRELAERLARDSGKLDVGVGWPEAKAVGLVYEDLLPAFRRLMPLYKVLG